MKNLITKAVCNILFGCVLALSLLSCKDKGSSSIDPVSEQSVTEAGEPAGQPTSKSIGAEGGIMSSSDGNVQLTIPAGALAKATTITIQPVTNQLPGGIGRAYRFSPDGTQFAKPATLTFSYDKTSIVSNDPEVIQAAFQDPERKWHLAAGAKADTLAGKVTVPMPHFSDWTAFQMNQLAAIDFEGGSQGPSYVELGGSMKLAVENPIFIVPIGVGDQQKEQLEIQAVKWSVLGGSGNGQVTPGAKEEIKEADYYRSTFTAPASYPPNNPVTVVAEVSFKSSPKKLILLKKILIGKDYFTGDFDGVAFKWQNLTCTRANNTLHVGGFNENPDQSLHIILSGVDFDNPARSYTFGKNADKGAWSEFSDDYKGVGGWISAHNECKPGGIRVSDGTVRIANIDEVNGVKYVRGSLTGTFYNRQGACPAPLRSRKIKAEFRIKLTEVMIPQGG
ncbi:hypothetical protein LXM25_20190 [Dyadobacter sp. LJ53]|uniref:hypothetical protein n=1 Tax=Dyadobacter chenwenxiniae TaxID=2906456 RepID=UPI001F26B354|nr:hypothetical protein [Dyadobacter chenwenxiniae]MCF0052400.1 hypothetical protein [Dyadobacter chenwenxiniae]